jgi:hypothetical protein
MSGETARALCIGKAMSIKARIVITENILNKDFFMLLSSSSLFRLLETPKGAELV